MTSINISTTMNNRFSELKFANVNISDLIPMIYICTVEDKIDTQSDGTLIKIPNKRISQMKEIIKTLKIPNEKIHWNIVPRMHQGTQQLSSTDNHLLAMKHALKNNHKYVLILEDDITIRNDDTDFNFEKCILELNKFLYFWNGGTDKKDIIYLGHLAWELEPWCKPYTVVKSLGQCIHAYIINENMMKHLTQYSCHDIINESKKHWSQYFCGYALDTFITIKVREGIYNSYAFYPQFLMQDSIPKYNKWSITYENLAYNFNSFIYLFPFFGICFGLFYLELSNKNNEIYKYLLFAGMVYCIHKFMRMMKK